MVWSRNVLLLKTAYPKIQIFLKDLQLFKFFYLTYRHKVQIQIAVQGVQGSNAHCTYSIQYMYTVQCTLVGWWTVWCFLICLSFATIASGLCQASCCNFRLRTDMCASHMGVMPFVWSHGADKCIYKSKPTSLSLLTLIRSSAKDQCS